MTTDTSERTIEVLPGEHLPVGASWTGTGTNFSLFSEHAERVELCLFDDDDNEVVIELGVTESVQPQGGFGGYTYTGYQYVVLDFTNGKPGRVPALEYFALQTLELGIGGFLSALHQRGVADHVGGQDRR